MGLYIIVGASGPGKKFIMNKLKALVSNIVEIQKMTTRPCPAEEKDRKSDLIYGTPLQIIEMECEDLVYQLNENKNPYYYGIKEKDIIKALVENKNPIIIVRNYEVLIKLQKKYPQATLIRVLTGDTSDAPEEDSLDQSKRYNKEKDEYLQSIEYSGTVRFDGYIENNFNDSIHPQIQKILFTTEESKFLKVFLACQFSTSEKDNYDFEEIENVMEQVTDEIRDALGNVYGKEYAKNFEIVIAKDENIENAGSYIITDRIYKEIKEAQFVICDLSVDNGNVFYEYEYALQTKADNVIAIAAKESYGTRVANVNIEYSNYIKLKNDLKTLLINRYKLSD